MIKITRFFYVHFLTIPLFILAYFTKTIHTLLMAYSIVSVHELFHLVAALLLKVRIGSIIIMPFGMTLRLGGAIIKNPAKEIIIALSGPIANVIMLLFGVLFKQKYIWAEESMFLFNFLNAITLIINLLPVIPLDGGRVLKAMLTHFCGYITGMQIMRRLTAVISTCVCILGLIVLFSTKFNVSLILAGGFLLFNLLEDKKKGDIFILKELMRSRHKLDEKALITSRIITASENTLAKNVLSKLTYDRYFLIYAEGEKGGRIISESELVEGLIKHGYAIELSNI